MAAIPSLLPPRTDGESRAVYRVIALAMIGLLGAALASTKWKLVAHVERKGVRKVGGWVKRVV